MIVIVSAEHVGTRFCMDLLKEHEFWHRHVENEHLPEIRHLARNHICVVPMRHPRSVMHSWAARGREPGELCDAYRRLYCAVDPLGPFYLPIDASDRDEWLALLNETGLNLKTDWSVIGKNEEPLGTYDPRHEVFVGEILSELKDYFGRFGYEP